MVRSHCETRNVGYNVTVFINGNSFDSVDSFQNRFFVDLILRDYLTIITSDR